jgi:hypothetical protein
MNRNNEDESPRDENRSRLLSSPVALWAVMIGVAGAGTAAVSRLPDNVAHREVYYNIRGGWSVYPLLAMLVSTLLFIPFQRSRLWRLGRPVDKGDNPAARLKNMVIQGFAQHRVRRDRFAAAYHMFIFLAIVNLFIVTTILLIDSELITPMKGTPFLQGWVYKAYSLYGDLFGIIGIVGVLMAFYRRYIDKTHADVPDHYIENRDRIKWRENWTDHVILWVLLWLLVGGFAIEVARIAATELR